MTVVARTEPSPLGRYTPFGRDTVSVALLDLPVRLIDAGRQHHDGVLREFRLVVLSGRLDHLPAQVARLADVFGRRYAAPRARRDDDLDDALRRGLLRIDQRVTVPASAAGALEELQELLAEIDEVAAAGHLLTPPRPPRVRAAADWYAREFVRQGAGEAPCPWDGPLDL